MEKEYYTIKEIAQLLSLKESTLYSKVETAEIPHYRVGRLIRLKLDEVEEWMKSNRAGTIDPKKKAGELSKSIYVNPKADVDRIIRRAIDEGKRNGYTGCHGKPDQTKGRKGGAQ